MNKRMVFYTLGRVAQAHSVLLLFPAIIGLIYRESAALSFLYVAVFSAVVGTVLSLVFKPKNRVIYSKEGFVIVTSSWFYMSLVGCLPFVISGEIPSFTDAFFETVSGFTTTGASIIENVEKLSRCMLFWRSFSHFIGGMGVLVFVMAILPNVSDRSIHILRAEMPGPVVGKIVPRIKETAKILYLIYLFMTLLEMLLLYCGEMDLFESAIHAFGTAGTGGFSMKSSGLSEYSAYSQWVITIFMLLFGVNFNLYFLLLIRRFKSVIRSGELWCYASIVAVCTAVVGISISPVYKNVSDTVRTSAFQVASIVTTTGYSTADFNAWPSLAKGMLFVLMFCGGCAGSTAGGLKISRSIMLVKMMGRELRKMLHPRSVATVRFEDKPVEETVLNSVGIYFAIYIFCILATFLLICFEPFGVETNFAAAVSCFNNVGPALGIAGPAGSYASYSIFSKWILSMAMLMGRLEIYPVLIALSPATWTKK